MHHEAAIRQLIAEHARLPVDVASLATDADLYQAGLTSLSTVNLMLALEERFDIEFPDRMLGRKTFGTIASLGAAIAEITGQGTRDEGRGQPFPPNSLPPSPSPVPRSPSPFPGAA